MKEFVSEITIKLDKRPCMPTYHLEKIQRSSVVLPDYVGNILDVHNGKKKTKLLVLKEMIGYRLGEFVKTRKTFKYKKK
jgi:ribosomal protein S19